MSKPYQTTPDGVVSGLVCGQWVKVDGYKKPARFVRYNSDGTAYVVKPTGKGRKARVNMKAFRLACGKGMTDVLGKSKVRAKPIGPAEDRESYLQEQFQSVDEAVDALLSQFF